MQPQRGPERGLGLLPAVEQGALAAEALVQGRQRGVVGPGGEPQRPLELGGRLAVRAQGGGPAGRFRRVAADGRRVGGALGVVGEQRGVGAAAVLQRGQQPFVQLGGAVRRDAGLDRHPDQLVPEPQPGAVGHEDPGAQALVEAGRVAWPAA